MKTWLKGLCVLLIVGIVTVAYADSLKVFDTAGVPRGLKIAPDGSQDVNIQDQTTRPAMLRFSQITDLTPELAEVPTVNTYTITLKAGHSVTAGENLSLIYIETGADAHPHYMTSKVLGVATNVLTMDEPVPYAFPVDSIAYTAIQGMNVDGDAVSGAQVFGITNAFTQAADITQIIFHITDNAAMDDALFGAESELTRGVLLRKKFNDGHYENIFNVKSNGEFGELTGPAGKVYDDKAPSGVYGLTVKVQFAGQGNVGVAIRLNQGEAIELVVQDDIDGLLSFTGMVIGHFTD